MSEENINIATKEYADAHFGNTSETDDNLVIATKEYVDSIPTGMRVDGTALKGQLCSTRNVTTVGDGADGSTLTDGSYMFMYCNTIASWTTELPNLTIAHDMFYNCTSLTSWSVDLPKLEDSSNMFEYCSNLAAFSSDLSSLTNSERMFSNCTSLTSWAIDLPNLTVGYNMFYYCSNLASFSGDLSKLAGTNSVTGGTSMFKGCSKLTSFNSALPKLGYGQDMFKECILDEDSVLRILNSIPTHTSGTHPLHLGKRTNYQTSDKVAAKLRTSTGGTVSTPIPAATNYRCVDDDGNDKGWTITVQA